MDNSGAAAFAAVMAIAVALHEDGVLPLDRFIETLRRHALKMRAAGAEDLSAELLAMASQLATSLPPRS